MSTTNIAEGPLAVRIGERLRALRKQREMTLAVLAQQAGISTSYLSAVEKGANLPSLQVLAGLTDALGVSIPSVLADEGSPHVRVSRLPSSAGVQKVSHPLLQLDNAVVKANSKQSGDSPCELAGHDLFVYVVSGKLRLVIDQVSYQLGAGDAVDVADPRQVSWLSLTPSMSIWSSCPRSEPS
jgi:transcriptional regulator with XRE-family HTH domain